MAANRIACPPGHGVAAAALALMLAALTGCAATDAARPEALRAQRVLADHAAYQRAPELYAWSAEAYRRRFTHSLASGPACALQPASRRHQKALEENPMVRQDASNQSVGADLAGDHGGWIASLY